MFKEVQSDSGGFCASGRFAGLPRRPESVFGGIIPQKRQKFSPTVISPVKAVLALLYALLSHQHIGVRGEKSAYVFESCDGDGTRHFDPRLDGVIRVSAPTRGEERRGEERRGEERRGEERRAEKRRLAERPW